ncbi:MAG TPA: hypothetical protein VFU37_05715 [Pyrinomonadaceae bacterium]|nr:hypothetical protein [Pyrinomonadaceae bacterium]
MRARARRARAKPGRTKVIRRKLLAFLIIGFSKPCSLKGSMSVKGGATLRRVCRD